MEQQREEIVEKISRAFPSLRETEKSYLAGYIMHAAEEQERREEKQTA